MDESAILGKVPLTTIEIALGFTPYNFPVAMQFFPNCTPIHVITYNKYKRPTSQTVWPTELEKIGCHYTFHSHFTIFIAFTMLWTYHVQIIYFVEVYFIYIQEDRALAERKMFANILYHYHLDFTNFFVVFTTFESIAFFSTVKHLVSSRSLHLSIAVSPLSA